MKSKILCRLCVRDWTDKRSFSEKRRNFTTTWRSQQHFSCNLYISMESKKLRYHLHFTCICIYIYYSHGCLFFEVRLFNVVHSKRMKPCGRQRSCRSVEQVVCSIDPHTMFYSFFGVADRIFVHERVNRGYS